VDSDLWFEEFLEGDAHADKQAPESGKDIIGNI